MAITGTLVHADIDYHDERGWTADESATSDKIRRTWKINPGSSYQRVQIVNGITKIFDPHIEQAPELQNVAPKETGGGFPGIFYYKQ